ncbi:L10-interacting MYB domain-containing protein-like [Lactuca sativa]|uniref:L10-interacting MYB domain-containing protein-like n=1 Tax=Lactuca sativa TaxID=4236 RepID=UPI000CD9E6B7|nr:L10-interacting MYB domain-containing protein-like [Lactuca sativa]
MTNSSMTMKSIHQIWSTKRISLLCNIGGPNNGEAKVEFPEDVVVRSTETDKKKKENRIKWKTESCDDIDDVNFNGRKLMLVWNESEDKTFLDACIHELITNGREGSGLKDSSWKTVREKMINEHSKEVDQKQMRNHFDYYKSKYVAWVKLKNKTDNIYDPIKNKFNLTDEQWKEEGKLNKYLLSLKTKPLLVPDLCTQLFEGSTSPDFQSWGPSSTLPRPIEDFSAHDFDDDVPMETSTQHVGASEESSGRSKNMEVGGNKKVGGKKRDIRALEAEEDIVKLARSLVEKMKELKKVKWIRMLMRVWRN